MKSAFYILTIISLTLFCGLGSSALAQTKIHFVIDPGHGGKDPGTMQGGVNEKILSLDLAKRVKAVLTGLGHSVTLTRETDIHIPLEDRAAIANKIPNSLFISLHFNSSTIRSVAGIETHYWPGSVESQKLASFIQGELCRRIVTRNRGLKPNRELKVLEATKGTAALVECGFLSNRWECQRCQASWYRQVLAEEVADALARFSKLPKPPPIIPTPVPADTKNDQTSAEKPERRAILPISTTPPG